jgi:hypothetical protein
MTYDEFQRQVGKAGLTMREFADLLRMNPISLSNYAKRGEVPSHLAVIAALLGTLAEKHIDFRMVLNEIDIAAKKPRGGGTSGHFGGDKQNNLELFTGNKQ